MNETILTSDLITIAGLLSSLAIMVVVRSIPVSLIQRQRQARMRHRI
jgi:hypothetical protein